MVAAVTDPLLMGWAPVPRAVTQVGGCSCDGMRYHDVRCSIWQLPYADRMAAVEAAEDRLQAHTAELNRELQEWLRAGGYW